MILFPYRRIWLFLRPINYRMRMYEYKIPPIDLDCGVTITQYVMGAKWKPYLINCMTKGIHRPVEFQRVIKGATRRVLVQQLGELESVGVVRRVVHDTVPMKTEYFLTEFGESLVPIIRMMDAWGNEHRGMFDEMGNIRAANTE